MMPPCSCFPQVWNFPLQSPTVNFCLGLSLWLWHIRSLFFCSWPSKVLARG